MYAEDPMKMTLKQKFHNEALKVGMMSAQNLSHDAQLYNGCAYPDILSRILSDTTSVS